MVEAETPAISVKEDFFYFHIDQPLPQFVILYCHTVHLIVMIRVV